MTSAVFGPKTEGLIAGHAYTTIGVKEWQGAQYVIARNPWGSEHYKGRCRDGDTSFWSEAAKKHFNHTNANDGTFVVPMENYMKLFHSTTTALYRPYKQATKVSHWDRKSCATTIKHKFKNPVAQDVSLGIVGPQAR